MGDLDIISQLLSFLTRPGQTPVGVGTLITAIQYRDYELMNLLMELYWDITHRNDEGLTAFTAAVQTNDVEIVRYILERGADIHDSDAVLKSLDQSPDILELLSKEKTKRYPRVRPGWGAGALKAAIDTNNLTLFSRLLTAGADLLGGGRFRSNPGYEDLWLKDDLTSLFGHAVSLGRSWGFPFVEYLLQINGWVACKSFILISQQCLQLLKLKAGAWWI